MSFGNYCLECSHQISVTSATLNLFDPITKGDKMTVTDSPKGNIKILMPLYIGGREVSGTVNNFLVDAGESVIERCVLLYVG